MKCASCNKAIKKKSKGVANRLANKFCDIKCQTNFSKKNNYYLKRKKKGVRHVQPYVEEFERQIEEIEFQNTLSRMLEL
jgi:hypothetical protein